MASTENHEDFESLLTIIADKNELSLSVLSFLKKFHSDSPEVLFSSLTLH